MTSYASIEAVKVLAAAGKALVVFQQISDETKTDRLAELELLRNLKALAGYVANRSSTLPSAINISASDFALLAEHL